MLDTVPRKRPEDMAVIKHRIQSIQFQWTMRRVRNSWPMERNITRTTFDFRVGDPTRVSDLYVTEGTVPGKIFRLNNKIMNIGRSNDCDIFLEDRLVSRFHASLHRLGNGKYALRDNESNNGTFINGQRLKRFQEYLLYDRDEIKIGDTLLIFRE